MKADVELPHIQGRLCGTLSPDALPELDRLPSHDKALDFLSGVSQSCYPQSLRDPLIGEQVATRFQEISEYSIHRAAIGIPVRREQESLQVRQSLCVEVGLSALDHLVCCVVSHRRSEILPCDSVERVQDSLEAPDASA